MNFLAALHGYRNSMRQAQILLDKQLLGSAQLLWQVTRHNTSAESYPARDDMMFQVWNHDQLVARSANAPDTSLPVVGAGYHDLNYNNSRWRVLLYIDDQVTPGESSKHTVMMAERADLYTDVIEEMVLKSILPIIWVLPLIGLFIWGIVSIGLMPLKRLAALLRNRDSEDRSPLAEEGYPQELVDVVTSTNILLNRLEFSFDREKRFAADAAHELRTPLATLKVNLHNLAEDVGEDNANFQLVTRSANRMAHSVEQILALYRLNAESARASAVEVDLEVLVRDVIVNCYARLTAKQQKLEFNATATRIHANPFAMEILVGNLLDNASKYTPAGGEIVISVGTDDGSACIAIEDSGPGIPEASILRVFDRFYRLGGDSHHSGAAGCGLGLSIVESIVNMHHGEICLSRSTRLGGLKAVVILPQPQSFASAG
jgi:two-component system sensor histidine kinase QseC